MYTRAGTSMLSSTTRASAASNRSARIGRPAYAISSVLSATTTLSQHRPARYTRYRALRGCHPYRRDIGLDNQVVQPGREADS